MWTMKSNIWEKSSWSRRLTEKYLKKLWIKKDEDASAFSADQQDPLCFIQNRKWNLKYTIWWKMKLQSNIMRAYKSYMESFKFMSNFKPSNVQ